MKIQNLAQNFRNWFHFVIRQSVWRHLVCGTYYPTLIDLLWNRVGASQLSTWWWKWNQFLNIGFDVCIFKREHSSELRRGWSVCVLTLIACVSFKVSVLPGNLRIIPLYFSSVPLWLWPWFLRGKIYLCWWWQHK